MQKGLVAQGSLSKLLKHRYTV